MRYCEINLSAIKYIYCRIIVFYNFVDEIPTTITKKLNIEQLRTHFKDTEVFETADIVDFYIQSEPGLTLSTINWRIYSLVQKGILNRVSKGKFRFGSGKFWQPEILPSMKSLHKRIKKEFPYLKVCIWHTSVINEFMIHQPFRFYLLIEVEKDATEAIFFGLKDARFSVLLDPTQELIDKYTYTEKEAIIVKSLVSEAPLQILQGIFVPTLEKILVDIFCDDVIFASQQGLEMRSIFAEAFNKYTVIEDRLLRYANRRGKKESISNYINTLSKIRQ